MAATILRLANGHTSLEFSSSELSIVAGAIKKLFGEPKKYTYAELIEYRFGGSIFIFQNEWDDPCLISGATEGDDMLRQLWVTLCSSDTQEPSKP